MQSQTSQWFTKFQYLKARLQLPFQPLVNTLFRLNKVDRYFVVRTPDGRHIDYTTSRAFYLRLVETLEQATKIRIALGEMGHRLADNPELLAALERAFIKNQAIIEVIHGPRVDPATRDMFSLAWSRKIRLFMTPHYNPRHFIIAEFPSGRVAVMDEGIHDESLWTRDADGQPVKVCTNIYKLYYFRENSRGLARKLNKLFDMRLATASEITDRRGYRPDFQHPYPHPIRRTFLRSILNLPERWLLQPLENFFDVGLPNLRKVHAGHAPELMPLPAVEERATGLFVYNPTISPIVDKEQIRQLRQILEDQASTPAEREFIHKRLSQLTFD